MVSRGAEGSPPTKQGLSPVSAVGLVQPRGLVRKAKVEIISLDSYSSQANMGLKNIFSAGSTESRKASLRE